MVRITLIQKRVFITKKQINIKKNLENAKKELDNIEKGSTDIIVFPEYYPGGYTFENNESTTVEIMKEYAKNKNCYILFGEILLTKHKPKIKGPTVKSKIDGSLLHVYNTVCLVSPKKNVQRYCKIHLDPISEPEIYTPGNKIGLFNTKFGSIGIMICRDYFSPELFSLLSFKGAKLILLPSLDYPGLNEIRNSLIQIKAFEECIPIVNINGIKNRQKGGGNSIVVVPYKRKMSMRMFLYQKENNIFENMILAKLSDKEEKITVDINLDKYMLSREEMQKRRYLFKSLLKFINIPYFSSLNEKTKDRNNPTRNLL